MLPAGADGVVAPSPEARPPHHETAARRLLGLTFMIGRNDTGPITRLDDSRTVLEFAKTNGVGRLGIWSLARDFGTCSGRREAQPDCSGIAQQDYDFTRQLGDPKEARLAIALHMIGGGACPTPSASKDGEATRRNKLEAARTPYLRRSPMREIRWLGSPQRKSISAMKPLAKIG